MTETLAQLVEVRVDLSRAVRPERDEAEFRVDALEQVFDFRVDHGVVLTSHFRGTSEDPVRLALPLAGHTDKGQQLADDPVDVVIDDHQVGQFGSEAFLVIGLA